MGKGRAKEIVLNGLGMQYMYEVRYGNRYRGDALPELEDRGPKLISRNTYSVWGQSLLEYYYYLFEFPGFGQF